MVTWVVFLTIGLVIGIAAGLFIGQLDDVRRKQRQELQNRAENAEQDLAAYKRNVTDHFMQTSALVNSMTESYKAVHEHLSAGAKSLCDGHQLDVAKLNVEDVKMLDETQKERATAQSDSSYDIRQKTPETTQALDRKVEVGSDNASKKLAEEGQTQVNQNEHNSVQNQSDASIAVDTATIDTPKAHSADTKGDHYSATNSPLPSKEKTEKPEQKEETKSKSVASDSAKETPVVEMPPTSTQTQQHGDSESIKSPISTTVH